MLLWNHYDCEKETVLKTGQIDNWINIQHGVPRFVIVTYYSKPTQKPTPLSQFTRLKVSAQCKRIE